MTATIAPMTIMTKTTLRIKPEPAFRNIKSEMLSHAPVIIRIATITAIEIIIVRTTFIEVWISNFPSFWNEPSNRRKTRRITNDTARKGINWTMIPTACPNEMTKSPITNDVIASICFFPFPRISDFWRIAKTIVKTNKKGRIASTKIGLDRKVNPPYVKPPFAMLDLEQVSI